MKLFLIWFALGTLGLPLIYLLAGGPITFMCERRWISRQTAETITAPAKWAADRGLLQAVGIESPVAAYYFWCSQCAH